MNTEREFPSFKLLYSFHRNTAHSISSMSELYCDKENALGLLGGKYQNHLVPKGKRKENRFVYKKGNKHHILL